MGIEGTYINIIKAVYDASTANIFNGEKAKSMSPKIRNKTSMFTLATIIKHSFGSSTHGNQRKKEIKEIQTGKEEVKLLLFLDGMVLYIKNPEDTTRK